MKFSQHFSPYLILLLAGFLLQSCGAGNNRFELDFSDAPAPYNTSQAVSDTTLAGGVHIFVLKKGTGPFSVVPKDAISVKYTARTEDGKIFASSFNDRNAINDFLGAYLNLTPFAIQNAQGRPVIPLVEGLRKGLLGMKEGEKRTIIVPPNMGYNEEFRQLTGRISNNQTRFDLRGKTLTYDMELVEIQNTQ